MTTTSMSSDSLSSNYLSGYSSTSFQSFARRHSIYGTEDRVVLDIGSLYIKCGFSGESVPRHFVPTWTNLSRMRNSDGETVRVDQEFGELYSLDVRAKDNLEEIEEKLRKLLHIIYFRLLLTDPKSRKVIICESPLAPVILKQTIARLLFDYFQVPSISFVPTHLMALLTTGLTSGLVIDIGNLEATVLPIYVSRPLIPYICTTPLAGKSITKRLKDLLFQHGRYIPQTNLHLSLAPHNNIPDNILTQELLEELKTKILFCSPHLIEESKQYNSIEAMWETYKQHSNATDLYYPITLKDGTKATLLIPGWIRERTTEVLFEGDEDEPSVAQCILHSVLRAPTDLRKPLISSMLLIGGISHVPGFRLRLKRELLRVMRNPTEHEKQRYTSLLRLSESVGFIDDSNEKGAGQIFMGNIRGWIGGSLVGSLKISGEEITKEKFTGTVTDWSIGNWNEISKSNVLHD